MFKAIVLTILVLCLPIAVSSAFSLYAFLSWICNFPNVFPNINGLESASFSGLFGYMGLTGYVALWRFSSRLSPRFKAGSDAETNSITKGIISGMLACLLPMFQFIFLISSGMPFPTSVAQLIEWFYSPPCALGCLGIALFTTDLFALMEMA